MRWTDTAWMKYIYTMQNLTFGSDGGLTAACEAKHPTEPHLCTAMLPPLPCLSIGTLQWNRTPRGRETACIRREGVCVVCVCGGGDDANA